MNRQDKQKYLAIKKLLDSGAPLEIALNQHKVDSDLWHEWQTIDDEQDLFPDIESQKYALAVETINSSAQTVRNLFVSFVFVLVFVFVMVASATDRMLFLNEKISMPIINIGMPASYFFAFAPVLILVLHANLVFNLYVLARKARTFDFVDSDLYFPFLFLQANRSSKLHGAVKYVGLALFTFVLVMPFILHLWMLHRFAIYQNDWVHGIQFWAYMLDVALFAFVFWLVFYHDLRKEKATMTPEERKQVISVQHAFFTTLFIVALYLATVGAQIPEGCASKLDWNAEKLCVYEKPKWVWTFPTISAPFFSFPSRSEFSISQPQPTWQYNLQRPKDFGSEFKAPELQPIPGMDDYINRYSKGVDLSDRNLRHIRCRDCKFQRADMRGVDFSGAYLSGSNFAYSDLSHSLFIGADLSGATFNRASLNITVVAGGSLREVRFKNTDFSGSIFTMVNLHGSIFRADSDNPLTSLNIYHGYTEFTRAASYLGDGIYGPMNDLNICDFKAKGYRVDGLMVLQQGGRPIEDQRVLSSAKELDWAFVDLAHGYFGGIRFFYNNKLHFINVAGAQIENLSMNIVPLHGNELAEIDVTGAKIMNMNLKKSLTQAMCLTPQENGIANVPTFSGKSIVTVESRWPICRPWPKEPIPCGNEEKMQALIDKTLAQPQKFCNVDPENPKNCVVE